MNMACIPSCTKMHGSLAILLLGQFLPAFLFILYIQENFSTNTEKCHKEKET